MHRTRMASFKPPTPARRPTPPTRRAAAPRAGNALTPSELHALRRSAPLKPTQAPGRRPGLPA
jgi:hypothetical protein